MTFLITFHNIKCVPIFQSSERIYYSTSHPLIGKCFHGTYYPHPGIGPIPNAPIKKNNPANRIRRHRRTIAKNTVCL